MPANHPYDPRYNAKIYVPKLTEEQRRARATPLENLRRPKLRPAVAPTASFHSEDKHIRGVLPASGDQLLRVPMASPCGKVCAAE